MNSRRRGATVEVVVSLVTEYSTGGTSDVTPFFRRIFRPAALNRNFTNAFAATASGA